MSERSGPVVDLESLTTVLKGLASHRIELHELRYYPRAFGSFELVVGTGHERVRFTWDGRDAILSVAFARAGNKGAAVSWTHEADISPPKREGLFAEIASNAKRMLARRAL